MPLPSTAPLAGASVRLDKWEPALHGPPHVRLDVLPPCAANTPKLVADPPVLQASPDVVTVAWTGVYLDKDLKYYLTIHSPPQHDMPVGWVNLTSTFSGAVPLERFQYPGSVPGTAAGCTDRHGATWRHGVVAGHVTLPVVNTRQAYEFRITAGPATVVSSNTVRFADVNVPSGVHLAVGPTPGSMRVMFTTAHPLSAPTAQVSTSQTGHGTTFTGTTSTYTRSSMCDLPAGSVQAFRPPGMIHDVLMTGLLPNTRYFYRVGGAMATEPTVVHSSGSTAGGASSGFEPGPLSLRNNVLPLSAPSRFAAVDDTDASTTATGVVVEVEVDVDTDGECTESGAASPPPPQPPTQQPPPPPPPQQQQQQQRSPPPSLPPPNTARNSTCQRRLGHGRQVWSAVFSFMTPPAPGDATMVTAVVLADSGVTFPYSTWAKSYPAAALTYAGAASDVADSKHPVVAVHVGDLAYAAGWTHAWDWFMQEIQAVAASAPYMVVAGNHDVGTDIMKPLTSPSPSPSPHASPEPEYPKDDAWGECGVPFKAYFHMPGCAEPAPGLPAPARQWRQTHPAALHLRQLNGIGEDTGAAASRQSALRARLIHMLRGSGPAMAPPPPATSPASFIEAGQSATSTHAAASMRRALDAAGGHPHRVGAAHRFHRDGHAARQQTHQLSHHNHKPHHHHHHRQHHHHLGLRHKERSSSHVLQPLEEHRFSQVHDQPPPASTGTTAAAPAAAVGSPAGSGGAPPPPADPPAPLDAAAQQRREPRRLSRTLTPAQRATIARQLPPAVAAMLFKVLGGDSSSSTSFPPQAALTGPMAAAPRNLCVCAL